MRVGIGFDVHAFETGQKLYLGGVEIPSENGLKGHSDADVVLHAVIDSILGAAGYGDIGELFPDNDQQYKNIRSTILLEEAVKRITTSYKLINLDMVIICEKPKILPYREQMRASIAALLNIPATAIMLKGKTTEKLGFTGRGEGIACQCVTLLDEV